MKSIKNILLGSLLIVTAYSCSPKLEGYLPEAGDADFSSYVAIGNSLTSGYTDGALSYEGQRNSFPMILANQFALAGGGVFKVPYLPTGNGVGLSGSTPITHRVLQYVADCRGAVSVSPVLASGVPAAFTDVRALGPYNLVGVPGAYAIHGMSGLYSFGNPYLARFASQPGVSSMLSEALRVNPTFFTLWLGSNDVLGFATSGGLGKIDPASPSPTGGDLISPTMVGGSLTLMVDSLVKRGAQGVIANIPDITSTPFFTTIPYNGVVLSQGAADTLNGIYTQVGLSHIVWKAGANPFVIEDTLVAHPTLRIRQAKPGEYILLTTPGDSLKCAKWGVSPFKALGDRYVLDATEVAAINAHVAQYNAAIANIAAAYNIGLVDMNSYMKKFTGGMVYNGASFNAKFISGGAFGLDGVHPNQRGYALIANEFIRVINAKYHSTLTDVDVNSYKGILFP